MSATTAQERVMIPLGATHTSECYGDTSYYKKSLRRHLNQVSEKWQMLTQWFYWDAAKGGWCDVGPGFSTRRLEALT